MVRAPGGRLSAAATSPARWPRTTTTSSRPAARAASSTCWRIGRPPRSSNCLGRPRRDEVPPASTIPEITAASLLLQAAPSAVFETKVLRKIPAPPKRGALVLRMMRPLRSQRVNPAVVTAGVRVRPCTEQVVEVTQVRVDRLGVDDDRRRVGFDPVDVGEDRARLAALDRGQGAGDRVGPCV